MTLHVAARRLGQPTTLIASTFAATRLGPSLQCRHAWTGNPLKGLKEIFNRSKKAQESTVAPELDDPKSRQEHLRRSLTSKNASGGIFEEELKDSSEAADATSAAEERNVRTRENMAVVTDPDPRSRIRWQRRKVMQMVRSRGVVSREDRIKMTEREHLHKSKFLPTSTKKLVMLARQIAGKPVDDAITQMHWSKKKMAAEVKYYLEEARDLAVAQRGMGLGRINGELLHKPRKIQTKDGKWIEVSDPTRMYVAQSWVGRGPWRGKTMDYKARARFGIIQHPSTSLTILLKEEKTRIREHDERETRKKSLGPWVHLPNRKVSAQRPYYVW
ncbi:Ribosomal protein L22 [Geosmithia morbida]|uniref:Ribosomal protein L22 n=1 Tax=Geosmithia morbida TaxID=1094350 RepID=A0A9P4YSH3_9HYPO|nr:Ribosomal protein L22 [Geosmithia morbida]KAF4121012.1 Ribosomal protein L22 [Geosmithia morbida]